MNRRIALFATLALGLTACGGGGAGSSPVVVPPPPPPPVTKAEAFQFLNQASFGATEAEADRVMSMGIDAWIDEQMRLPMSLQMPHMRTLPKQPFSMFQLQKDRVDIFFRNALHGSDVLRQRVAFALSEIMVTSDKGALVDFPYSLADYYDVLTRHAFGNYRDLIEEVTLHPAMGVYLSMLGNEKPDPANNIRPDENYARELMQLFSIGLVELNLDGTARLDAQNQPIPTYDQSVIEGFAHVFTGWTYAGVGDFHAQWPPEASQYTPMQLWSQYHDNGTKTLLHGVVLPAGQTGAQDLDAALDNIFQHANVGPFISRALIQRLVTSNPSPDYVSRVATVFNDNGSGVKGDLGAVVKAILTDAEARPAVVSDTDGKIKEPLLRILQLWRAYDARSDGGRYPIDYLWVFFGQGPLQAPHVFNFFAPTFSPPGEFRSRGLVAPELEIATEYLNSFSSNFMLWQIFYWTWNAERPSDNNDITDDTILIDYAEEMAIAGDVDALIDRVDGKLLGGTMSGMLRQQISTMVSQMPADQPQLRAAEVIYLVVTSPEFVYQR
ncbi:MAG: DUF1800 domain-containing protein [Gammaproteobacteria bacterium]|nr:DUF1800 domain-containing protein [Gammaproteobacteria bacterium]